MFACAHLSDVAAYQVPSFLSSMATKQRLHHRLYHALLDDEHASTCVARIGLVW